jgi:hypothetical protein
VDLFHRSHGLLDIGEVLFQLGEAGFGIHGGQRSAADRRSESNGYRWDVFDPSFAAQPGNWAGDSGRKSKDEGPVNTLPAVSLLGASGGYSGTLALSFLAAVLIMSPFAYRLVRRTLALERARALDLEGEAADPSEDGDRSGDEPEEAVADMSELLAVIDELGIGRADSPRVQIEIPIQRYHDGLPMSTEVSDLILVDALEQAGWQLADRELVAESGRGAGRDRVAGDREVWTCVGRPSPRT